MKVEPIPFSAISATDSVDYDSYGRIDDLAEGYNETVDYQLRRLAGQLEALGEVSTELNTCVLVLLMLATVFVHLLLALLAICLWRQWRKFCDSNFAPKRAGSIYYG